MFSNLKTEINFVGGYYFIRKLKSNEIMKEIGESEQKFILIYFLGV